MGIGARMLQTLLVGAFAAGEVSRSGGGPSFVKLERHACLQLHAPCVQRAAHPDDAWSLCAKTPGDAVHLWQEVARVKLTDYALTDAFAQDHWGCRALSHLPARTAECTRFSYEVPFTLSERSVSLTICGAAVTA